MKSISTTKERLLEIIRLKGISQADICRRTGISTSLMGYYCTGKRCPKQNNINIIADAYNVNPEWLMGYDVPMNADVERRNQIVLSYFNQLPESKQDIILSLLKSMVGE